MMHVFRYLSDNNDGYDVTVDRVDSAGTAAAPRVAMATPRPLLASLLHGWLRGARAVHAHSHRRLLRMRTTRKLRWRHCVAQQAAVETRCLFGGRFRSRFQRTSGK